MNAKLDRRDAIRARRKELLTELAELEAAEDLESEETLVANLEEDSGDVEATQPSIPVVGVVPEPVEGASDPLASVPAAPAVTAPLDPEGPEAPVDAAGEQPGTQAEADAISTAAPAPEDVPGGGEPVPDLPPAGDPADGGVSADAPAAGDASAVDTTSGATEAVSPTNDDAELVQATKDAEAAAAEDLAAQPDGTADVNPVVATETAEPGTTTETPVTDTGTEPNSESVG